MLCKMAQMYEFMVDLEKNSAWQKEKCLIHLFDSLFFPKFTCKPVNVCQYFNGNYIFNMELIWQLVAIMD